MQLFRHLRTGLVLFAAAVCQCAFALPPASSAKAVADVFAPATAPGSPAVESAVSAQPISSWSVSNSDDSYRSVLGKWTIQANASADAPTPRWKFVWDYDQEVSLGAEGNFNGDFKSAVRWLLDSTTMLDTPLQPCFYTNNVVRVIRITEKCDPSE